MIRRPNGGAAAARNTGLREAKGDYIAFLDGDDLWFPGKLTLQVRHLEAHAGVGLVFTDWVVWTESTGPRPTPPMGAPGGDIDPERSGWLYHRLLLNCELNTSTVLIRRSIIDEVGEFDETLRNGQDYDYWLRIARLTEIHKLAAPLAVYRHHGGNSTQQPKGTNYPYVVVTRALARWGARGPDGRAPDSEALRDRLAEVCFGFAYEHLWKGDPALARRDLWRGLGQRPFRARMWAYLLISLAPRLARRLRAR